MIREACEKSMFFMILFTSRGELKATAPEVLKDLRSSEAKVSISGKVKSKRAYS